ncbi:MAG: SMP-30/gluconolactonase/LRE family protein [Chloroflexota bacterium]
MSKEPKVCVDINALVGEGPIWDEDAQVLYWIDILSSKLYVYDPVKKTNTEYDVGQHVGTVVPRKSGGVMLAVYRGFASFDLETQELKIINDPESHLDGNRFNDGKCDPAGRFWAGTMGYEKPSTQGSLYRMDTDFEVRRILGNIGISNGIAWTQDNKTMYYADTVANQVWAFDYDIKTGDITNQRTVIRTTKETGPPDGFTLDEEGMIWLAHYGGSSVRRWNPDTGEILQTITLPTRQITACAFGGKKLDTLFITSAAQQMSAEQLKAEPTAGNLFSVKVGVKGVPSIKFGG